MKIYGGFKAQKNEGFLDVPPVGAYEAVIQKARFVKADGDKVQKDQFELFIDITEGDYKGRYMELYNDQKEKWGDKASYKGMFRIVIPAEDDELWKKKSFEHGIWAINDSNDFEIDFDKEPVADQMNGKKICINVRKRMYTYNGKDKETTEIGRLESMKDYKAGKVKEMNPNDRRSNESKEDSTDGSSFTDVSKSVDVPW